MGYELEAAAAAAAAESSLIWPDTLSASLSHSPAAWSIVFIASSKSTPSLASSPSPS